MSNKKYNIVFLFPDQLRADFVGCYGADFAKTPNIDHLANEGIKYDRCISPTPLCVPARASLLTGCNAMVNGVFHNDHWLRPDHEECGVKTWPKLLSENGYYTSAIGKMHFYPWDIMEGFDYRIISEDKRHIYVQDDYYEYLKERNLHKYHGSEMEGYFENKGAGYSLIPPEHQVDKWVGDQTVDFIKNYDKDKPFAVMVGFPGPHCPYDPPKEFADKFLVSQMPDSLPSNDESNMFVDDVIAGCKLPWNGVDYTEFTEDQKKKIRAHYCGLINQIDESIGNIIKALKEKGELDNTIIIFASDHGDYVGDFDMIGKAHFYGSSVHVPLIIRHPDVKKADCYQKPVSLTDIHATLRAIGGVDVEEQDDSVVLPMLDYDTHERDFIFAASNHGYMVIKDNLKYCWYNNGLQQLFDLKRDKNEQNNLIDNIEYAADLEILKNILIEQTFKSTQRANLEKNVVRDGASGQGAFGKRNWQRTYPEGRH